MASALKIVTVGNLATLPFGSVPQGQSSTLAIVIRNTGTSNLTISAVSLTVLVGGSTDFTLNGWTGPLVIAPSATDYSLSITFTPSSPFETLEQATLQFTSDSTTGVSTFNVTGTCSNPGSVVSQTTSNESVVATQTGTGSTTNNSPGATFAAYVVPAGARVTLQCNFQNVVATSGSPTAAEGKIQVSYDAGANWSDLYGSNVNASLPLTFTLGVIANLNTLQVRVQAFAVVPPPGGSAQDTVSIDTVSVTAAVGGDDSVQPVYTYAGVVDTFPIVDFGSVIVGASYIKSSIKVNNLTAAPLAVTLSFDTAAGYVLDPPTAGTNPVPAGDYLVFRIKLVPPKGGNQDDLTAVTIASGSLGFSTNVECLYQAPAIVAAYTLVGDEEQTIMSMSDGGLNPGILRYFDPTIESDGNVAWARQLYIDQPHLNKTVNRVFLLYERKGTALLTLSATVINPKNVPIVLGNQITLPADTDGKLGIAVWDLQITGSVILFTYSVQSGIVSIVGFILKVDEIGEVIENT